MIIGLTCASVTIVCRLVHFSPKKQVPKKEFGVQTGDHFWKDAVSILLTIVHYISELPVTCSLKWPLEGCLKFWVPIARVGYPGPLGNCIHIDGWIGRWGIGRH